MIFVKKLLNALLILVAPPLFSAPWNNGIEVGTSVGHFYGSRSLFTNPAAIAYEKELNGGGLLNSFTYGSNFNGNDEFSLSTSYQLLGFGYERLYLNDSAFSRYQLGLGYSITPDFFWGTRIATTSSENSALAGDISLDVGFQYRPISFMSLGLLVSELNQSTINGIESPINYTLGAVIRPAKGVTLTADLETSSKKFLTEFGYQATLALEPFQGIFLSSGYQKDHRFQVGVQWDLNRASLFSVVHASPKATVKNNSTRYTVGFQTSAKPLPSFLNRANELRIVLDDSLSEEGRESSLFVKGKTSLLDVLESLETGSQSDAIQKINVHLQSFPLGLAAAEEVAEGLLKAKESGKEVNVYLSSAKTKEYLIASAASQIYLEPGGDITILGPRASKYFAKGTMDKLGVEGEFLARGEYKSAPEMFTRKGSSPESKEATQHELKQMDENILALLQRTRKVSKDQWQSWLKYAVFNSTDAIREKLVDKIGGFSQIKSQESLGTYFDPSTSTASHQLKLPNRIAVITADGSIMENRNRLISITGQSQITPSRLEPLFKRALKDPRTKAIVFRVSSPGGEVLASEQIAALVAEARSQKPVIVSMGDYAASGGYYISAPAETIFANRLTLTGSIGVFLGKFNLRQLFSKLDLKKEVTGVGPYPGIDSEHKPWTFEERAIMVRRLNQFYESFVDFVAKTRGISKDNAEKAAKGRVWLGKESINLKLVDRQGGLIEAIQAAKAKTGLTTEFVIYPVREPVGIIDAISEETSPVSLSNFQSIGLWIDPKLQNELAKLIWVQKQALLYLADGVEVF